jgi:tetratricopeptide (TPR) repeat protein
MRAEGRLELAAALYEQSVFGGDESAIPRALIELDHVEADLALARGRILHARFLEGRKVDGSELTLFERAAQLYEQIGDVRGEAEAQFWVGTFHQVVRGDTASALPSLQRSYALATEVGDRLTQSYAARHLGFADLAAGDNARSRERLEESVLLRRELGFQPGVAAGLLALAEVAAEEGRRDDALAMIDEAAAIATASGANGIRRWIDEARAGLATND